MAYYKWRFRYHKVKIWQLMQYLYIYTKLGIQGTRDGENHKMKTLKTVSREFP